MRIAHRLPAPKPPSQATNRAQEHRKAMSRDAKAPSASWENGLSGGADAALPLVSVIIPCYNQGQFLKQALASVEAQSYANWECLIVNDGSTDDTEWIASSAAEADQRVLYLEQANRGLSAARNRGLEAAPGAYIQFLDADDLIEPSKLSVQVDALERLEAPGLSYCNYWRIFEEEGGENGEPLLRARLNPDHPLRDLAEKWGTKVGVPLHCFLFDSYFFRQRGIRFDEGLRNHEDWDCWMRIFALEPKVIYIDQVLAFYRVHHKAMSADSDWMIAGFIRAIEKQQDCFADDPVISRVLRKKHAEMSGYLTHRTLTSKLVTSVVHGDIHRIRNALRRRFRRWRARPPQRRRPSGTQD